MKLGETLRETVEQTRFAFEGRDIPLTVSVGVAELALHIANGDELVRIAERRVGRAKALGRNRVVSSDEQPEAAEIEPPDSPPAPE